MDDGVDLVADVTYPTVKETTRRAPGPFPVLLTQNPYRGVGVGPFGNQLTDVPGEYYAQRGYIFVSVDIRGTSRSGGTHDLSVYLGPRQGRDGAELVTWASKLPGSTGTVGLQGCSYLGVSQLNTARFLGAHSPVKAMIPACSQPDPYRQATHDNGIPSTVTVAGLALAPVLWDGKPRDPVQADVLHNFELALDGELGGDSSYYRDDAKARDRMLDAAAIAATKIPTLFWAGWQEGSGYGSLELWAALQNAANGRDPYAPLRPGAKVTGSIQAIVGDWSHGAGLDDAVQLQWFDTWLKGIDTGLPRNTKTPLHVQERGSGRWVNASSFPVTDGASQLFLGADGLISRASAAVTKQVAWGPAEVPGGTLTFAGKPLAGGATYAGPGNVELFASSSNTNMQFFAEVVDVGPDGKETNITNGSLLASRRAMNPGKSWLDANHRLVRPYLELDRDTYLQPGTMVKLEIPLQPTVWSVEPGHALAVRISTQAPQDRCALAANIGPSPVGCVWTKPMLETLPGGIYTVSFGGANPSVANLPLLSYRALPGARPGVTTADGHQLSGDW
jgi:predicted acyl esterase